MSAIQAEHETQTRILHSQKSALDNVITEIIALRSLGKPDPDVVEDTPEETSRPNTPAISQAVDMERSASVRTREESGELREDEENDGGDGGTSASTGALAGASVTAGADDDDEEEDMPLALTHSKLNATAKPFVPRSESTSSNSIPVVMVQAAEEDDIEMGELAEDPVEEVKGKRKPREEELEEGEASDLSSELSELPDD